MTRHSSWETGREVYVWGKMTDSCVVFVSAGPLPEPVVNGGMEEKVRDDLMARS